MTSVSTTVTIPDQGTILIGGQRIVSEFDVETGVQQWVVDLGEQRLDQIDLPRDLGSAQDRHKGSGRVA